MSFWGCVCGVWKEDETLTSIKGCNGGHTLDTCLSASPSCSRPHTRSFSHKQTHATPAPSPFVLFVWRVKGGRKSSSIKLCNGGQDTTPPPHHTPCFLSQRFPKNHNLGYPRTLHSPVCLVSSCVLCGGRGMCACVRLCGWNGNCAAATS